ncbi:kinase-like domain-containing protein [Rhizophagus clarus]|uniref:Kinase-like domain-containing protein n=1 Tax=Rhizophagus clarus TaxID=94130 RepID=A0A8H3KNQ7_9GLOM|nr:kinase-like domain-containing protein [Rhizophagus clarus]
MPCYTEESRSLDSKQRLKRSGTHDANHTRCFGLTQDPTRINETMLDADPLKRPDAATLYYEIDNMWNDSHSDTNAVLFTLFFSAAEYLPEPANAIGAFHSKSYDFDIPDNKPLRKRQSNSDITIPPSILSDNLVVLIPSRRIKDRCNH